MFATALALLLMQDKQPTAEEFLKKVEDKHVKAKTLRIKAKLDFAFEEPGGTGEVEAVFKEGNRVKLSLKFSMAERDEEISIVCDGKQLHVDSGEDEPEDREAPEGVGDSLRTVLVRGGSFMPMLISRGDNEGDPSERLKTEDLKYGADEAVGGRKARVLEYTLALEGEKDTVRAKVWIDAETLAVLKREMDGDRGDKISETVTETVFDADIADGTFELPEEPPVPPPPRKPKDE